MNADLSAVRPRTDAHLDIDAWRPDRTSDLLDRTDARGSIPWNAERTTSERLGDGLTTTELLLALPSTFGASFDEANARDGGRIEIGTDTAPVPSDDLATKTVTRPAELAPFSSGVLAHLRATVDLARHENLPPGVTAGSVTVSTAFGSVPGESTHLVDVDRDQQILLTSYGNFVVEGGRVVERLSPGDTAELGSDHFFGPIRATLNASGDEISLEGTNAFRGGLLGSQSATISLEDGRLRTRHRELFGFGVVERNLNLSAGDLPVGVSTQEAFDHYAATPEGQALLASEGDVYGRNTERQEVFVARVRFARGEGGRALFDDFTPRRASLSGAELIAYDALVDRVIDHIDTNSYNTSDNATLDSGLQYIIASGLVEAFGVDETRVGQVLDNLAGGWIVSHDGNAGVSGPNVNGTYWPAGFEAQSGFVAPSIGYRLSSLIDSYARPNDGFELIGHEAAHAIDGTASGSTDGLPTGLGAADAATVRAERARLDQAFAGTGDTLGLDLNAYSNAVEFWAEFSERFLSGPNGREIVRAASPLMFGLLTRYYSESAE